MRWANFFHIYQPPRWPRAVVAKVARESYRPLIRFLGRHRHIKITLNISGSLTEQLIKQSVYRDIIKGLRNLVTSGQVELTDSAMYHAILPLLPAREIKRQVALNHAVNRRAFGKAYAPKGFFPPEMAYSPKLGKLLSSLGYRWIILDGISHPGIVDYTVRYRIRDTKLTGLFRNRYVSDYLAFAIDKDDTRQFLNTVQRWNNQREVLVTAMDGENLGHHRHAAKRIWQSLVHQPHVDTVTVSELIDSFPVHETISARTASWSSEKRQLIHNTPFALWRNPKNALHVLQWRLFILVYRLLEVSERKGVTNVPLRKQFDESVASDWYWWASCEPWWDVDIVVAAAQRLSVIGEEFNPPPVVSERIRKITADIISTAHRWQSSGSAQRHAARYLKNEKTPRYLGGKSVSY